MSTNDENTAAKHSPRPWKVTQTDPTKGADKYYITANHERNMETEICEIIGGPPSAPANAALIAAAPELLAACRKKLTAQMLRETALAHELYTARDSAMQAAEEAEFEADEFMHAAIAKAEGRTA